MQVLDATGVWRAASIIESLKNDNGQIDRFRVHFINWPSKSDGEYDSSFIRDRIKHAQLPSRKCKVEKLQLLTIEDSVRFIHSNNKEYNGSVMQNDPFQYQLRVQYRDELLGDDEEKINIECVAYSCVTWTSRDTVISSVNTPKKRVRGAELDEIANDFAHTLINRLTDLTTTPKKSKLTPKKPDRRNSYDDEADYETPNIIIISEPAAPLAQPPFKKGPSVVAAAQDAVDGKGQKRYALSPAEKTAYISTMNKNFGVDDNTASSAERERHEQVIDTLKNVS